MENISEESMLSEMSTSNSHGENSNYFLGWQTYEKNPYDKTNNPFGIIQMGLAENQLSFDILESWLKKNPEAMQFKKNGVSNFREIAMFKDPRGLPAFKNALAKFMSMVRRNKVAFDPKNLILTAGATSANEVLMFCIANPGEAILLPTPYYPGFDRDLKWRTGVEIVPIDCTSLNGFKIDESALNKAYLVAKGKKLKVKGVFVTNPSNPLGVSLSLDELHLLVNFVIDKGIHLISDEIFSGTVFKSPNFVSVMEVLKIRNLVNNEVFQRVHIVYSLSKDFGLPGFRAGAIYSNNSIVVSTATRMSNFGLMSSQTQHFLSVMLSDRRFTSLYISQTRKRLKKRQEMLISGLKESGITCLESNAGLFCWVDMRQLLSSNTFEAEYILWKRIVHDVGIHISPGSSCHCVEPGWFRICFANISEETLTLAMHRLKSFVDSPSKNDQARHQQQPKIGLSISNSLTRWLLLLLFLHLLGLCFYAFMY